MWAKTRAMSRNRKATQSVKHVGDNLEPYRRLVELQKQMIELAQQHEQSRREYEALRVEVAKEIAAKRCETAGLNQRWRTTALRLISFNRKESSPC
jgi:hypothetical protein